MSNVIDLTDKRFGRLVVIDKSSTNSRGCVTWKCKCDCGNIVVKPGDLLRRGGIKSCGCLFDEKSKFGNPTHGKCHTRLYRIWSEMKSRCCSKTCKGYKNYGLRGISICDEWLGENGFENFYNWSMRNGYSDELTIDRINNDGNYEPSNCRWTDYEMQANNKRNNTILTLNGVSHTLAEWSRITGIRSGTISRRVRVFGWSVERALTEKVKTES